MLTTNGAGVDRRLATTWQSLSQGIKSKVYSGLCLSDGTLIRRDSSVLPGHDWLTGLTNDEKLELDRLSAPSKDSLFHSWWSGTYTGDDMMVPEDLHVRPSEAMSDYLLNRVFYPIPYPEAIMADYDGQEFARERMSQHLFDALNTAARSASQSVMLSPYLGIEMSLFPAIGGSLISASPAKSVQAPMMPSVIDLFGRPRADIIY